MQMDLEVRCQVVLIGSRKRTDFHGTLCKSFPEGTNFNLKYIYQIAYQSTKYTQSWRFDVSSYTTYPYSIAE